MIETEAHMAPESRMDFVSIVTPNHMHFAPAKMALEQGFDVICDKPLAFNLKEALQLQELVRERKLFFAITHNYTGYPAVAEAREMCLYGGLGKVRNIHVFYRQGWLATALEKKGQKQAGWRTDPAQSGAAGCVGDIGTHAANLVETITDIRIEEVQAQLSTFVPGRRLDDNANINLRLSGGATGSLHCTQIAVGEENNLSLWIDGETGGIHWQQQEPNTLTVRLDGQAAQSYRVGSGYMSKSARSATRLPGGHPEGYLEAFANIYRNFADAIRARGQGIELADTTYRFPGVKAGVRGMRFINAVVKSAAKNGAWTKLGAEIQ